MGMQVGEVIPIQWQRVDGTGTEQCSVRREEKGYLFEGMIKLQMQDQFLISHYQIHTNIGWETRSVQVDVELQGEKRNLLLTVDELQGWWDGNEEIGVLSGCQDVDLQISPVTNSLAINREAMLVGESRLVTAAWVHFPDLALQPLRQRYTHLNEYTYLYESLESDFRAQLQVDKNGLVITYGEIWKRL